MSYRLHRNGGWLGTGAFWIGVLVLLPNCSYTPGTVITPDTNFDAGPTPRSDVIFCDIEKPEPRVCASEQDEEHGIRLNEAAIALSEGRNSSIVLDDSPAAKAQCGGRAQLVSFQGPFPRGFPVCLNCGSQFPSPYPSVTDACRVRCTDFFGTVDAAGTITPTKPPAAGTVAFCSTYARPSTNLINECYHGACTNEGTLLETFADPRRLADRVLWADRIGTILSGPGGIDLLRDAETTSFYDAGAVSIQWIERGDASVEFSNDVIDQPIAVGFTSIPPGCAFPCPDTETRVESIGFAVLLHDGGVFVIARGALVSGPLPSGAFVTFLAGQRFRIYARDLGDGTATLSVRRVNGICIAGTECDTTTLYTDTVPLAYPFRVDAAIREKGSKISDARLVYIHY